MGVERARGSRTGAGDGRRVAPLRTPPPARTRLIGAARVILERDGYEGTRVSEVCGAAGVSRTTFYAHFASKRALACAAHGGELAAVEALVERAGRRNQPWARQMAVALDEVLADLHDSPDTARGRLIGAMTAIAGSRGFAAATLRAVARRAQVSAGDFYRYFAGREDCLAVAVARAADEVDRELDAVFAPGRVGPLPAALALIALAEILVARPAVARLLLVEAMRLPRPKAGPPGRGWAGSLREALERRLVSCLAEADRRRARIAAAGATSLLRDELAIPGPVRGGPDRPSEGFPAEFARTSLCLLVDALEATRAVEAAAAERAGAAPAPSAVASW